MSMLCLLVVLSQMAGSVTISAGASLDQQFEQLAAHYLDEFPALSPVSATAMGDHRFDSQLDMVSSEVRSQKRAFCREYLEQLRKIKPAQLCRANQVDYALLEHDLEGRLWRLETLQEWVWNPIVYTRLSGGAIYNLMARDFAPLTTRLEHAAERLEQFPRLFRQIRATLDPKRVPKIHAETAVKQNRGVLSVLDNIVKPNLGELREDQRDRLEQAIAVARTAVEEHQKWLEAELLPNARGDFRLGLQLYDQKLAFVLKTPLTRGEIRERAEQELGRVRDQVYCISQQNYKEKYPYTEFPADPSPAYKQALIRSCLELAYREIPQPDKIVETAKRSLELTTAFVREKDLLTLPPDPVEIIIMPEFKRGVSLAYCDSPGPLDVGLKTFYAVAPLTRHHSGKSYREDTKFAGETVPQIEAQKRSRLDCVTPIVIRNNRWMHNTESHSWGIDLDDGSSNYHVYNNLCLGCSIKLREGFYRRVENNIFIGGRAIQQHVPFDHNMDYICRNIVVPVKPETMPWRNDKKKILDAEKIDNNLYWSSEQYRNPDLEHKQLKDFQAAGIDVHSISADSKFIDPENYDLRVADDSPALKLGFKNFPMDNFGVRKPEFRKIAEAAHKKYQQFRPEHIWGGSGSADAAHGEPAVRVYTCLGAKVKDLTTEEEKSVAGVGELTGVYVIEVPQGSAAVRAGIVAGDAILAVNGRKVANAAALGKRLKRAKGKTVELHVVGAKDRKIKLEIE